MKYFIKQYTALIFIILIFYSCHESRFVKTGSSDITVVGKVLFSGTDPFSRTVFISDTAGTNWIVENQDAAYELYRLAGSSVRAIGTLAGGKGPGLHISVEGYELMPVNGCLPVAGVINEVSGLLVLEESGSGKRIVLAGCLVPALRNFVGHRVWLCGDEGEARGKSETDECAATGEGRTSRENEGAIDKSPSRDMKGLRMTDTLLVKTYWVL